MTLDLNIERINGTVMKSITYEFQITNINKEVLILLGSQDLFYGHNMEILFKEPHFIESKVNWRVLTDNHVCFKLLGDEDYEFNIRNNILVDYKTVKFRDEDGKYMYYSFSEMIVEIKL